MISMLGSLTWFLWNPKGWSFEWEPIITFLGLLVAYITLDVKTQNETLSNDIGHVNDRALFKKLREVLPSNGPIRFARYHDFGGTFNLENVMPIKEFSLDWNNAEHEFIDEELEELKKELLEKSSKFSSTIAINTSPNRKGFQSVYPDTHLDSEEDFEKRMKKEIAEIHGAADDLFKIHQKIMKAGRKKLSLEC
jgi:hypothetical protein